MKINGTVINGFFTKPYRDVAKPKKKLNIKNFKSHQETLEKVSSLSLPFRDDDHDDSITK